MSADRSVSFVARFAQFKREVWQIVIFMAVIWIVFFLDRILPLEQFALYPRRLSGLPGVLASPFLHKDWGHIMANSVPMVVLLALLAGSRSNSRRVLALLILLSGGLLWVFGRSVPVVGASGVMFGLAGFLVASGIFERRLISTLVAVVVAMTYGSTILFGVLPNQAGVSWDGHLWGAIAGVLCAWIFRRG